MTDHWKCSFHVGIGPNCGAEAVYRVIRTGTSKYAAPRYYCKPHLDKAIKMQKDHVRVEKIGEDSIIMYCKYCRRPMKRRPGERPMNYKERKYCGQKCISAMRKELATSGRKPAKIHKTMEAWLYSKVPA